MTSMNQKLYSEPAWTLAGALVLALAVLLLVASFVLAAVAAVRFCAGDWSGWAVWRGAGWVAFYMGTSARNLIGE